jgi:putative hemolysin
MTGTESRADGDRDRCDPDGAGLPRRGRDGPQPDLASSRRGRWPTAPTAGRRGRWCARRAPRAVHQPAPGDRDRSADRPGVPRRAPRRRACSAWYGIAIAFVINVIVFFVLSESMPKTWAVLHTERAASDDVAVHEALVSFPPLRSQPRPDRAHQRAASRGGAQAGPVRQRAGAARHRRAAADDEVIEHEERELIESIIEFGDTVAREVMVPRPDMVIIPYEATVSVALDFAIEHGYSRLPVEGPDDEDVIGLAYTKDLMRAEREGRGDGSRAPSSYVRSGSSPRTSRCAADARDAVRQVPPGDRRRRVRRRRRPRHPRGLPRGARRRDRRRVRQRAARRRAAAERRVLIVGGTAVSIEELNELLDIDIPDDDWDTIGGFVFNTLGHPRARSGRRSGTTGGELEVIEVEGRRIRRLRIVVVSTSRRGRRRIRPPPGRLRRALTDGRHYGDRHAGIARRQGRARHRGVEGDRLRDREDHGGGGGERHAVVAQAGPARRCSGPDRRRDAVYAANAGNVDAAEACVAATIERFGGSTSSSTTPRRTRTTVAPSMSSPARSTRRSRSICVARCSGRGLRTARRWRRAPG